MSFVRIWLMIYLHCCTRSWITIRIRTQNPMAALYYTETVPIAQTKTRISIKI